jgi:hypothetical protein
MTGTEATEVATPERERAVQLDGQVEEVLNGIGRAWVKLGLLCSRMRDEKLYSHLGYSSFDGWMAKRVEQSRSSVYFAMKIVDSLSPQMSEEQIGELTKENAATLARLPESKRFEPEIMEQAKVMPSAEFKEMVESGLTPTEREERRRWLSFWCEQTQATVIEGAIELSKKLSGTESRAEALELICAEFLSGHGVEMEWSTGESPSSEAAS